MVDDDRVMAIAKAAGDAAIDAANKLGGASLGEFKAAFEAVMRTFLIMAFDESVFGGTLVETLKQKEINQMLHEASEIIKEDEDGD